MNLIVAVDENWGIGRDNAMLFHLPSDLAFFKKMTTGKTVVMGKNTLFSLPNQKPLPNRQNVLLSSTHTRDDMICCGCLEELFEVLKNSKSDDVFIIGGSAVYELMLPYCDTAYITKIGAEANATHFFPNLDINKDWEMTFVLNEEVYEGIKLSYTVYKNLTLYP